MKEPSADFWSRVDQSKGPEACWEWRRAKNSNGYGLVALRENGRSRPANASTVAYYLHTGVWPPDVGLMVLHACDNRLCCNPSHLRAGTAADNMRDAVERGRLPRGAARPNALLTDDEVRQIRTDVDLDRPLRDIAASLGLSRQTLAKVVSGKSYDHLGGGVIRPDHSLGERHIHAKLTSEMVRAMRASFRAGATVADLARSHNVAWNTAKAVVDGKSWKHVT